jgi:hypothetical protein
LLDRLVQCGEVRIPPAVDKLVRQASRPTLARLLEGARAQYPRRGATTTHPSTWLKQQIPIRTFADWDDARPGFCQVDLVAHCGSSSQGFYLYTLCAVDVVTSWVELQALWGKGHYRVAAGVQAVRERLPVVLAGLDSDNGSEFINRVLYYYCWREGITFTRGRAWKKNDSALVEQKNGAIVRRLIGYDRFASKRAYAQLAQVYALVRLHVNFFQPVEKLVTKHRDGARASIGSLIARRRRINASARRACCRRPSAPSSKRSMAVSTRCSSSATSTWRWSGCGPWPLPIRAASPRMPRTPPPS